MDEYEQALNDKGLEFEEELSSAKGGESDTIIKKLYIKVYKDGKVHILASAE